MMTRQREADLQALEALTYEYRQRHGLPAPELPPQRSGDALVLGAKAGLEGDAQYVHIYKHSDVHAGHQGPLHRHDFFEFNFLCRGHCHNLVNGQDLYYGTDTLILMNPDAAHCCWVESTDDQVVNFLVTQNMIERIFTSLIAPDNPISRFFLDSLYGQSRMPDYMLFHIDGAVADIFWNMIDEYLRHPPFYEQIILSDMIRLFATLARQNPAPPEAARPSRAVVSDIIQYMRRHYATVTLQELSDAFHYSYVHISRMLKKETGKSFSDLLTDYRLQHACNFLRNSAISAETISTLIGYSDVSYFYKVFKRRFALNPSEYRHSYGGCAAFKLDEL